MRDVNKLIVHCSASDDGDDIGVKDIRQWHIARGFKDIGYHFVIRRDGTLERGRDEEKAGAHAQGHNTSSIGICLIGGVEADKKELAEFNYTRAQMATLETLILKLMLKYPRAQVLGHKDLPGVSKACPCFDVKAWWGNSAEGAII